MARISEMRCHCRKGNNGVGIQEPSCHWRNEKAETDWMMVTKSFLCLNSISLKN
jgi:hypothetical protein